MDLGLEGKWALVCAASKGLGKGCAQALRPMAKLEGEQPFEEGFRRGLVPLGQAKPGPLRAHLRRGPERPGVLQGGQSPRERPIRPRTLLASARRAGLFEVEP